MTKQEAELARARLRLLELEEEEEQEQTAKQPNGASGDWGFPDPGAMNAVVAKFSEGLTKKGSDDLVGAIGAKRFGGTRGQYLRMPDGSEVSAQTPEEARVAFRDAERQKQDAADQHWPKLGFAADMAGEVTSDAALMGAKMIRPAYQALMGGARGYLGSRSDSQGEKLASTALGAGFGYGAASLPALGKAASETRLARAIAESRAGKATGEALMSAVKWPGEALERAGVATGRRVLMDGQGSLSGKTALPDEAVREAMDSGAVRLFGTTRGAAKRLDKTTEAAGQEYGRLLKELEDGGVKGPNVMGLFQQLREQADELVKTEANDVLPSLYRDSAESLYSKGVAPAGQDLRLGLRQAVGATRALQRDAKYGKYEETPLNEAKRDIARRVRVAVEDEVESSAAKSGSAELQNLAAQFVPAKKTLSNLIPADAAAFRGAEQASKRNAFSLTDYLAAGAAGAATQNPIKTGAALLGAHVLRTRGPSTAAVSLRALGKGTTGLVQNAPEVFGEFGAVIAGQKTPEARVAIAEELAQRYPAFAQMLKDLDQPSGEQASPSPAPSPRPGDPLRAGRRGR